MFITAWLLISWKRYSNHTTLNFILFLFCIISSLNTVPCLIQGTLIHTVSIWYKYPKTFDCTTFVISHSSWSHFNYLYLIFFFSWSPSINMMDFPIPFHPIFVLALTYSILLRNQFSIAKGYNSWDSQKFLENLHTPLLLLNYFQSNSTAAIFFLQETIFKCSSYTYSLHIQHKAVTIAFCSLYWRIC